jgi:hypothetical protein
MRRSTKVVSWIAAAVVVAGVLLSRDRSRDTEKDSASADKPLDRGIRSSDKTLDLEEVGIG